MMDRNNDFGDDNDDCESPHSKKQCQVATPESFKIPENAANVDCRPRRVSKDLFRAPEGDAANRIVRVTGLPSDFLERVMLDTVERARMRAGIAPDKPMTVRNCFGRNSTEGSVLLAFESEEIAEGMWKKVKTAIYQRYDEITFSKWCQSNILPPRFSSTPGGVGSEGDTLNKSMESLNLSFEEGEEVQEDDEVQQEVQERHSTSVSTILSDSAELLANTVQPQSSPIRKSFSRSAFDKEPEFNEVPTNVWQSVPAQNSFSFTAFDEEPESNEVPTTVRQSVPAQKSFSITAFDEEPEFDEVPTTSVRVSNLPENVSMSILEYELLKLIWQRSKSIVSPRSPIETCTSDSSTSATVVLESVHAARFVAGLKHVMLNGKDKADLSQVTFRRQRSPAPLPVQKAAPAVASMEVKVNGLPEKFDMTILKYELLKSLWGDPRSNIEAPTDPIVCMTANPLSQTSAIVKFDTPPHAASAAALGNVEYGIMRPTVHLCRVQSETSTVHISNLPENFKIAFLRYEVLKALWSDSKSKVQSPTDPIVTLSNHPASSTQAIVKFDSCETASFFARLKKIPFFSGSATLQLASGFSPLQASDEQASEDHADVDTDIEGADKTVEESDEVLITSAEGEKIMIKLLLRCRQLFKGRNHSRGYSTLLQLLRDHNVNAQYGDVVVQRERIRDKYKRYSRIGKLDSWCFARVCSVIFDQGDVCVIPATQRSLFADYLEPLQDAIPLAGVSDGASWPVQAGKALIAYCFTQWHDFKNPSKHAVLFRNAAAHLQGLHAGYVYSAAQCQRKIENLQSKYRRCAALLHKTGSPPASEIDEIREWPYWDSMHNIMQKDVSAAPHATHSGGSTHASHENMQASAGQKRPKKEDPLQVIAAEMKRKNDLLEKRLEKQ